MSGSAEYCPGSGLSTKHVPSAQSVPVLTMQRGAGESPVAKGTGSCMAGLCSRTGGVIFAFKKDLVKSLPPEGRDASISLGGVSGHLQQWCVLQPHQCFLKGGV